MFVHRYNKLKNYTGCFADSLGEMVFRLKLMTTGTLIFLIKQEIFGYTDSFLSIIYEEISLMHD